ncbi:N-acetyltransferase family protein [Spirillospora sp. CA-253888]
MHPHTSMDGVVIRAMRPEDADQVLTIYQQGLDTGHAGFETTAPTWAEFDSAKLARHRHVAADGSAVLGWIAAARISDRSCYAGVVEHTVHVCPHARGLGIGAALLDTFIADTEAHEIWTVQTGIFPENIAGLRLHHRAGFRTIGVRERLGRHHGRWRDVALLERRSATAGTH